MKRYILCLILSCLCLVSKAQAFEPITWTAYGVSFEAPKDILVEEDTEDTFLLNSSRFYITLHALDSEDMNKDDLGELLKGLADDDEVQQQSEIQTADLQHYHVVYLKGITEEDPCCYACLMTKDAGSVFYVSIIYNRTEDKVVERMLRSFKMEEGMGE